MVKPTNRQRMLVRFDPDEIRNAIAACDTEARRLEQERARVLLLGQTYRQLLQLHEADDHPKMAASPVVVVGTAYPPLKGMTMADAAFTVLSEAMGNTMHGREILSALERRGRPVPGSQPMSSLQSAMDRDPRIERVPGKTNTWRLSAVPKVGG